MAKRKRTQGQRSTKHTYIQKYAKDMISHSLQTAYNVAKLLIYENMLIMFDQTIYANMTIHYNITPMRLIAFHRFNLYRSKYMYIILL